MNFEASGNKAEGVRPGGRFVVPALPKKDFDGLKRSIDLRKFIEADLGQPLKNGRWACPIHGGKGPNFSVNREHFKCFTCEASGDLIDYVMLREGCTRVEAIVKLDPFGSFVTTNETVSVGTAGRSIIPMCKPATPPAERSESILEPARASDDPAWQAAVSEIVRQAEASLWDKSNRDALNWIRNRGLTASTIRRFRLGFLPESGYHSEPLDVLSGPDRKQPRIWAERGIFIPWIAAGSCYDVVDGIDPRWVGANVRRLPTGYLSGPVPEPKYQCISGSERGHAYPWPDLPEPGLPAIITEGEFDALIGWQEAGWICNVVSFGGAQQTISRDGMAFLSACPDWLLLFDFDGPGDQAARNMYRKHPTRCRRLFLPPGINDLNDLYRGGGVVPDWLETEWERFGWRWRYREMDHETLPEITPGLPLDRTTSKP